MSLSPQDLLAAVQASLDCGVDPFDDPDLTAYLLEHPEQLEEVVAMRALDWELRQVAAAPAPAMPAPRHAWRRLLTLTAAAALWLMWWMPWRSAAEPPAELGPVVAMGPASATPAAPRAVGVILRLHQEDHREVAVASSGEGILNLHSTRHRTQL